MSKTYLYHLKINHDLINAHRSEEEYGDWGEDYSNYFRSVSKTSTGWDDYDAPSFYDFNVGDVVHVLWADYDQGDSFGYSRGGGVIGLLVCSNYDEALKHKTVLEEGAYADDSPYTMEIVRGDQKIPIYRPWTGYFENLRDIYIETAVLQG